MYVSVTLLRLGKHWLGVLFMYLLIVYLTIFVCLLLAAELNDDFMFYCNVVTFCCLLFNLVTPSRYLK